MSANVSKHNFGKQDISFFLVRRDAGRELLRQFEVNVSLESDARSACLAGDISGLMFMDDMSNAAYTLTSGQSDVDAEKLAQALAEWCLEVNQRLLCAQVQINETPWARLSPTIPYAFSHKSVGHWTVAARVARDEPAKIESGFADVLIVRTLSAAPSRTQLKRNTQAPEHGSSFPCISLTTRWKYNATPQSYSACRESLLEAILHAAAILGPMTSQQETLYRLGLAGLSASPEVSTINLDIEAQYCAPPNPSLLANAGNTLIYVAGKQSGRISLSVDRQ
ncbi:hypothetical protein ACFWIB_41355 [Streptomyces sp. NPDC127051]|uniref:hypothetical protein n=1 Tax=Streptomyces sp. NPDC127051 TaxID=3347119 RepID=UPI00364CDE08